MQQFFNKFHATKCHAHAVLLYAHIQTLLYASNAWDYTGSIPIENENKFYLYFYTNSLIFNSADHETCILLDVALSKCVPEAIIKSFYSKMWVQQQGAQPNETLMLQAELYWMFPSIQAYKQLIRNASVLYIKGINWHMAIKYLTYFKKYLEVSQW